MSHLVTIEVEIKDLDALAEACPHLGCEFMRNQTTHKWFGRRVGGTVENDVTVELGMQTEQMGKCLHAIRVKGGTKDTYEVGVVQKANGKFALVWDSFAGGYGLMEKVGNNCENLTQEYAAAVAIKQCKRQGMQVMRQQSQDGKVRLVAKA